MRILIVEDEPTINAQLTASLTDENYVVDCATDGRQALFLGLTEPYDAIILDLGLPQMDGISVLKSWRDAAITTPVIILTARDNWNEKVIGIDAGADDYLAKPFRMEELLARLRAIIRRAAGHSTSILSCGGIELHTKTAKASVDCLVISLTSHEFKVLSYLMHHQNELVSRTVLTEHIYAQDFDRDSNTIEVFIGRLRKKLPPGSIETVRGGGYRLVCPN
jgi:two-component system OmpR family response regulator